MAYEIVPYAPEFEPQIIQLQTHLWGAGTVRNAAYLEWKYAANPFFDDILMQLALCDGRVVAMRGLCGTQWEVDDSTGRYLLPYADDFVVAPEHRKRGPASLVMQAALAEGTQRGFPYAISLGASPITFVSSLAAGWRSAGPYESVWRRRTPSLRERVAQRIRQLTRFDRVAAWWRTLQGREIHRPFAHLDARGGAGPMSVAAEPRPQAMAALIERLPWDGRIRHVRNLAYFTWRFRNPLHEYRFVFWDDGGGLRGYLVLQRYLSTRADTGCVNIVDWEAADERVRAELLRAALQWGRFPRVHTWAVGRDDATRALLREHGFVAEERASVRKQSGLLVHPLAQTPASAVWQLGRRDLLRIADWDPRMLYSMAG